MTAVAALLLLVTLAAACILAATRWPRGGRIARLGGHGRHGPGSRSAGCIGLHVRGGPDQAGSFGADVAATFGIVMAGAGALLVALAVAIQRGNDETRGLVAALLGAVGGLSAWWIVSELAQGPDDVNTASVLLSASGLAGIGVAALLFGASGAMTRLQLWRR